MTEDSPPPGTPEPGAVLLRFIEATRAQGASDDFIYHLLERRGWSPQDIDAAFSTLYEQLTGYGIPRPRGRRSESARDAFLYLLSFATLGIWIQALGEIGFITVNWLVPDPLNPSYWGFSYSLAASLARLIVVFPIYLVLMRMLNTDLAEHPDKYQSGIRKWLTYLALLIAALIAIVTVVVFLTSLLQGELTLRFTLKVLIVFVLAGGVLWYYLNWLQRQPRSP
jgi:hypothetical protein